MVLKDKTSSGLLAVQGIALEEVHPYRSEFHTREHG